MLKKLLKRIGWALLVLFLLTNVFAAFHAYKFTHYTDTKAPKTDPRKLSFAGKMKTICFGVDNPRPVNGQKPAQPFETILLQSHERLECWYIKTPQPKGTVILFHGYGGQKSSMLDKSDEFLGMGYNTLLVDFMGSGGSGGNYTTIGYKEAQDVKAAYDHLQKAGERNIYLFGTSQGAAAVLKALHDYPIHPKAIIIECPFATLYQAAAARFRAVGVPVFPLTSFLVFWGGVENGFWGFAHKPVEYARSVKVPALLFYGEKDERVTRQEIDDVFANLAGEKQLVTFKEAGHVNYLRRYRDEWHTATSQFLMKN